MTGRGLCVFVAVAALVAWAPCAGAGQRVVALFPPENLAGPSGEPLVPGIAKALAEKLSDRFDVRRAADGSGPAARRARARSLGASYVVTGTLSRVGRTVTLDLTIAPVENQSAGRTVVVNAVDDGGRGEGGADLPAVYRRLVLEAAARLKYGFFGDDSVGEGPSKRRIPRFGEAVSWSRPMAGDLVSAAAGDVDGDGTVEVLAATPDAVIVYRVSGEELVERTRVPFEGAGLIHVEAADIDRDGKCEIVAVTYRAGRARTDVLRCDGSTIRFLARDVPFFVRVLESGPAGVVLGGQESSPATVFAGPVFRCEWERRGDGIDIRKGTPFALPPDVNLFGVVPLKGFGDSVFAALGVRGTIRLVDRRGAVAWEGVDAVGPSETFLEAPLAGGIGESARVFLPGRLLAADLDGDGVDEIVALNNLAAAGAFFDGIRVFSDSEALCFTRDGDGLRLAWRSGLLGAAARDAFLESGGAGPPRGIAVASRDRGKVFARLGEWRLVRLR